MQKGLLETSHEVEEPGDAHAPECTWEGEERGREAESRMASERHSLFHASVIHRIQDEII